MKNKGNFLSTALLLIILLTGTSLFAQVLKSSVDAVQLKNAPVLAITDERPPAGRVEGQGPAVPRESAGSTTDFQSSSTVAESLERDDHVGRLPAAASEEDAFLGRHYITPSFAGVSESNTDQDKIPTAAGAKTYHIDWLPEAAGDEDAFLPGQHARPGYTGMLRPIGIPDEIKTMTKAFETDYNAGKAAQLGGYFTADALLTGTSGEQVNGMENISAYYAGFFQTADSKLTVQVAEVLELPGGYVYVRGNYLLDITVKKDRSHQQVKGIYTALSRREGQQWKIWRQMQMRPEEKK